MESFSEVKINEKNARTNVRKLQSTKIKKTYKRHNYNIKRNNSMKLNTRWGLSPQKRCALLKAIVASPVSEITSPPKKLGKGNEYDTEGKPREPPRLRVVTAKPI